MALPFTSDTTISSIQIVLFPTVPQVSGHEALRVALPHIKSQPNEATAVSQVKGVTAAALSVEILKFTNFHQH